MKVIADGWVCCDRLHMMANGELCGDPIGREADAARIATATAGWCYAGHDPADMEREGDHTDKEFSWTPCRTCGCTLGGSRAFAVKLGHA